MTGVLFWVFMAYDALVVPPYFWVKVALGIATGFPGRIAALLACALANAAIVSCPAFPAGRLGSLFSMANQHDATLLSADAPSLRVTQHTRTRPVRWCA
jgi:hypothetical protein